jgi:hypothetical protein
MLITPSMVQQQGSMVQITIPKKIEKQFRSSIFKEEGFVCLFTNLNAIDIKQKTYTYHHQHVVIPRNFKSATSKLKRRQYSKICIQFLSFSDDVLKGHPIKTTNRYYKIIFCTASFSSNMLCH